MRGCQRWGSHHSSQFSYLHSIRYMRVGIYFDIYFGPVAYCYCYWACVFVVSFLAENSREKKSVLSYQTWHNQHRWPPSDRRPHDKLDVLVWVRIIQAVSDKGEPVTSSCPISHYLCNRPNTIPPKMCFISDQSNDGHEQFCNKLISFGYKQLWEILKTETWNKYATICQ